MTEEELNLKKEELALKKEELLLKKREVEALEDIADKPAHKPLNVLQSIRKEWRDLKIWSMQNHY